MSETVTLRVDGDVSGLVRASRRVDRGLSQMERSVRRSSRSLDQSTRSSRMLERAKRGLSNTLSGAARRARAAAEGLRKLGRQARKTAGSLKGAAQQAIRAQGDFDGLSKRVGQLKLGLTALALAMGLALHATAGFADTMSTVKAVTGATDDQFAQLSQRARELGASTRFTARQAAEAEEFLARAGFSAAGILASLSDSLNLASAGALDLGRSADILSNVLSAFQMGAHESGVVADDLALATARANTNVTQLGDAMAYAAPTSAALGQDLEQVISAISMLGNAGIQGEMAGTAVRGILAKLSNMSRQAQHALEGLGLTWEEVNPAFVDLETVLQRLSDAGLDAGAAFQIFGQRAGPAALFLTQGGVVDGMKRLTEEMESTSGAAADMATTMEDNLGGSFRAMISAAESFGITFGAHATPGVRDLTEAVTALLRQGAPLAEMLGRSVSVMSDLSSKWLPVLIAGMSALAVVLGGQVVAAIRAASISWAALNAGFLATPLGMVTAGLAAAAAAVTFFALRESEAERAMRDHNAAMTETEAHLSRLHWGLEEYSEASRRRTAQLLEEREADLLAAQAKLQLAEAAREAAKPRNIAEFNQQRQGLDAASQELDRYKNQVAQLEFVISRLHAKEAEITEEVERRREEQEKAARERARAIFQAQQEAEAAREAADAEEERARKAERLAQARREARASFEGELRDLRGLAAAWNQGADAVDAYKLATRAAAIAQKQGVSGSLTSLAQIAGKLLEMAVLEERVAAARAEAERQRQQREGAAELDREVERMRQVYEAVRRASSATRELTIQEAIHAQVAREGGEIDADRLRQIRDLVTERLRLADAIDAETEAEVLSQEAIEDGRRLAEERQKELYAPLVQGWEDAQGLMLQGWERTLGALAGASDESFSDIFGDILSQFKQLLVQMLAEWSAMELQRLAISATSGGAGSGVDGLLSAGSSVAGLGGGTSGAGAGLSAGAAAALWVGAFYLAIEAYSANNTAQRYGTAVGASVTGGQLNVDHAAGSLQDAANAVGDAIRQIEAAMGEAVDSLPRIAIRAKNNGKKFKALVGNVLVGTFHSYEEALDAAVAEAFRQAGGDFSPSVRAALQSTAHSTIEGLLEHIQTAVEHRDLGLPQIVQDMREVDRIFEDQVRRFRELGLDLNGAITAWGDSLQALRDHIVGNQPDPFQQRLNMVDPFNQERDRREAELREELARYLHLLDQLMGAGGEISGMSHRVFNEASELGGEITAAIDVVVRSIGQAGGAVANRAEDLQQMIDAILAQLNALPDRIDPGDVRRGGNRQPIAEAREELDQILTLMERGDLSPTAAALERLAAESERAGEILARLRGEEHALAAERLAGAQAAARARILEDLDTRIADYASGGEQTAGGRVADLRGLRDELIEEVMELGLSAEETAARVNELTSAFEQQAEAVVQSVAAQIAQLDPIQSAAASIEQLHQQAANLRAEVDSLNISDERKEAMATAIQRALENALESAELGVLDRLFGYLGESREFLQQQRDLAERRLEMEFAILKAQLQALGVWDQYADVWQAARDAAMEAATATQAAAEAQREVSLSELSPVAAGVDEVTSIRAKAEELRDQIRETTRSYVEAAEQLAEVDLAESQALVLKEHQLIEGLFRYLGTAEGYEERRLELALQALEIERLKLEAQLRALGVWDEWADLVDEAFGARAESLKEEIRASASASTTGYVGGGTAGALGNPLVDNVTRLLDQLSAIAGTEQLSPAEQLERSLAQLGEIRDQLAGLDSQAALLAQFGVDLGEARQKVTDTEQALIDDFFERLTASSEPEGIQARLDAINEEYDAYVELAERYGKDVLAVEEKRAEVITALMEEVTGGLRGLYDELSGGTSPFSHLSARDELGSARSAYDQTLAAAQAGDLEALQSLEGVAQRLLQAGEAMYGPTAALGALSDMVRGDIEPFVTGYIPGDQLPTPDVSFMAEMAARTQEQLWHQITSGAQLIAGPPEWWQVSAPQPEALERTGTDLLPLPLPVQETQHKLEKALLVDEIRELRREVVKQGEQRNREVSSLRSEVARLTRQQGRQAAGAAEQRDRQIRLLQPAADFRRGARPDIEE